MGESLILRFYEFFNGQPVAIEQLIAYRQKVENYVDSIGSGEYVPKLSAIKTQITRVIKDWQAKRITDVEKLELVNDPMPVKVKPAKPEVVVKEVLKVVKQKAEPTKDYSRQLSAIKLQLNGLKKTNVSTIEKKPLIEVSKKSKINKVRERLRQPKDDQTPVESRAGKKPRMKRMNSATPLESERTLPIEKAGEQRKTKSLSGLDYTYTPIDLGKYKADFERLFSDSIVGIFGSPGHGKTTYQLKLGQYLATTGKKVLYVAREEYGRSVLDLKLKEHNIGHPNLKFNKVLDKDELKWADVVFLDSVNALHLNAEGVENIYHQYPNKLWFLILQSTKDGNFKGSQEWEHVVDVFGEVSNRKLILRKNRLDPNNSTKAEALRKTDAITEAKKKVEVKEAVKNAMAKPKPVPPATGNQQPVIPIAA